MAIIDRLARGMAESSPFDYQSDEKVGWWESFWAKQGIESEDAKASREAYYAASEADKEYATQAAKDAALEGWKTGSAAGAVAGPWGALVGGALGAVGSVGSEGKSGYLEEAAAAREAEALEEDLEAQDEALDRDEAAQLQLTSPASYQGLGSVQDADVLLGATTVSPSSYDAWKRDHFGG